MASAQKQRKRPYKAATSTDHHNSNTINQWLDGAQSEDSRQNKRFKKDPFAVIEEFYSEEHKSHSKINDTTIGSTTSITAIATHKVEQNISNEFYSKSRSKKFQLLKVMEV